MIDGQPLSKLVFLVLRESLSTRAKEVQKTEALYCDGRLKGLVVPTALTETSYCQLKLLVKGICTLHDVTEINISKPC